MHLEYSTYLARAVVSAMIALFLVAVKTDTCLLSKYRYARIGVAAAALLDMLMDLWGCWMIMVGVEPFKYHWVWAIVYYVEWTVLGICVLKLVESPHRFYWFPPLLIWYVFADSKVYRDNVDNNYAGSQNENLHELSYCSPRLFAIYLALTITDFLIVDNTVLDAALVMLSTVAIVWIIICIFNRQPRNVTPLYVDSRHGGQESDPSIDTGNVESRVVAWENRSDKPYCKESVSLVSVADELRVSPRVLSSYINSVRMVNFNSWINSLRVEEIKRAIRSNPSVDVYDLMVDSGFQSRSSLCRAVKNVTGMTVTQLKQT